MSAVTAVLAGRRAAEALMLDTCTIRRKTGSSTDNTTGVVTPTWSTVYTGRCKIQRSSVGGAGARRDVAEASLVITQVALHLPVVGSEGLLEADEATIDTAELDTDLVGKVFRVDGPASGSMKTARRLPVAEVLS